MKFPVLRFSIVELSLMKFSILQSTIALLIPLTAVPPCAAAVDWQPYTYTTRDGREITDGEIGHLRVPENRAVAGTNEIDLAFVRFRCTGESPGPPIVWLAGGPGDYGTDDIEGPYLELVRAFQEVADVIALDQRGTGLSTPRLDCPDASVELPLDRPIDPHEMTAAYLQVAQSCADYWKSQGVDLSAYTTVESVHDLDSLREALGVETINLYGGSYGTHLALAAVRLMPEKVHRVVLSGVEGPHQTWKLPSVVETHFLEVARAYAASGGEPAAATNLLARMRRLLERLDQEPVTVSVARAETDTVEVVVGSYEARLATRLFLGDLDNIRNLPVLWAAMEHGDFSLLGRFAVQLREVSVGSAMTYCMDCASGISPARLDRIHREEALPLSLVGGALNAPFPDICRAWPVHDLGETFRGPLVSDVPVLFVSGTLDGQTPPSNVSDLLPGFEHGVHLVVENATHQYLDLAHPDLPHVMADFFRGVEPRVTVLSAPPLVFETE
jgi:pimeloyl-ACP methyl ester carboxylesterase